MTISRHCLKSASTIISERKKCGSHWWIKLGNLIRYAKSHSIFRREPKVIVVEVRPLLWRAVGSIEDETRSHPACPCRCLRQGNRGSTSKKCARCRRLARRSESCAPAGHESSQRVLSGRWHGSRTGAPPRGSSPGTRPSHKTSHRLAGTP